MDILILRRLLEAKDGYVSGNELAKELDVSRVSIWGHLERLKEQGYVFEAVRNRGYKMTQMPQIIHPALIEAYLGVVKMDVETTILPDVDSTNTEVERQLADGVEAPIFVISSKMTQGRGRRGRAWVADDLGNLYMSFGFRPGKPVNEMSLYTLWTGVRVCDWLSNDIGVPAQIKWPNDILIEGKKLSGLLAESRIDGEYMRDLVFGIGTNVNTDREKWPAELKRKATSLEAILDKSLNLNQVAASLVQVILDAYDGFIAGNIRERFEDLWDAYDFLRNQSVTVSCVDKQIEGIVRGIDSRGSLRLELPDGEETILHAGDVSLSCNYSS